jgi:tetratricopeptide (TPR) repeat protein
MTDADIPAASEQPPVADEDGAPPAGTEPSGREAGVAQPARRSKWLRRLLAVAMGFGLLVVAELFLWIVDYGGPTEMFLRRTEEDGSESWVSNPDAFRSTFAQNPAIRRQGFAPAAPPQSFPVDKEPGVFRICVLGASTANGYPHAITGSFALLTESILNTIQADRRFEVFVAGADALTSYSLLGRVGEVADYGTDMVVIYCGHNEFYGLHGAGATMALSNSRTLALLQIWLRERRLSFAMGEVLVGLLPAPSGEPQGLAAVLPDRTDIRFGDATYRAARRNYRANLDAMVQKSLGKAMPAVLCTPVANLGSFPVLGSLHDEDVSAGALRQWEGASAAAEMAMSSGDAAGAAELWRQAADASPGHAGTRLELARALRALGEYEEAYVEFRAAADRDTLRWRAGSDFVEAVREVAAGRRDDVVLADCENYLRRHAGDGIPGGELFMEHVHPTIEGNFLLAESVARALTESQLGARLATWHWEWHRDLAHYERRNGIDAFQRISALRYALQFRRYGLGLGDTPEDERMSAALRSLVLGLTEEQRAGAAAAAAAFPGQNVPVEWLWVYTAAEYAARGRWEDALRETQKVRRCCATGGAAYDKAIEVEQQVLRHAGLHDLPPSAR